MYCDESARTAETAHSPTLESAAALALVRQTSNDSGIQPNCKSPLAGSPAATALPHTALSPSADFSDPPASSAQSAACPARVAQSPQSAGSFRSSSDFPIPWPRLTPP